MAATPVTPQAGLVSVVATGGTAVAVVPPNPSGGFITNPISAEDQGLPDAESLLVDPVVSPGAAVDSGWGTTVRLLPGSSWPIIPGQTTPTRVNAASSGHRFTVVWYP